ncbi:MAG: APC family permease, partial [Gemmatimonadota bacterium]
ERTAVVTRVIVTIVLLVLLGFVVVSLSGSPSLTRFEAFVGDDGWTGILRSAGLLFFAFAGYARIATLGEEVEDPERTIPRAIPLSLAIEVLVYGLVAAAALAAVGAPALADSSAPLATAVSSTSLTWFEPVVRLGGGVAALGVLLSLLAGVSRTVLAMARDRELPGALASVHPRFRTPSRAEIAIGLLVIALVLLVDLRGAIGFSSFTVLAYYAIANASAWTQADEQRRWPRVLQVLGVTGCLLLAATLPLASILAGGGVVALGIVVRAVRLVAARSRR